MKVLFGGTKGGTGKSTAAVNFAAALAMRGEDVLLLDCDKQRSSSNWAKVRANNLPDAARVNCMEKRDDVFDAISDSGERYKHIVVDAGGYDSAELRSAILAVEVVYVPIKPSQFDLWAVESVDALIRDAKKFNRNLKTFGYLSMVPTNPRINEAEEARGLLADFENLTLVSSYLCYRKPYRDSILMGKSVLELGVGSASKAVDEITNLTREILGEQVSKIASA